MSEEKPEEKSIEAPIPEVPAIDPKDAKLVKMMITFNPDTQEIQVSNVQNLTRPIAMYVTSRVFATYQNDEIAMAVVRNLSTVVEASKQPKDKLWVPGSKR